ncbi:MAG: dihydroorotate dehydrogenase-like protein [Acidobacteria bacterium]|jgi:dihydroorotate dehydrogenase (fumarate)|nr:dihydroorotate dehydrogenase-like protein [Acidobacteriota bacterium]
MDLSTTYLGLKLPHPLMPGASPMVDEIDTVRKLEDAGAAAIVMHSLFEEQISREQVATFVHTESHGQSFAEALTYFPSPEAFALGPDEYLEHVRKVKQAVSVPVIGSLNGFTHGGWLDYAKLIEQAGADALELNVYFLGSDPDESGASIEERTVKMVKAVRGAVRIPVAVKLSPYYTSLAQFTAQLDGAGADGLVLFNRFYQPDIDVEELQVRRQIHLSTSAELPLRLTWLALLSPKMKASLAVSGGVHTLLDVVQSIMTGAHAVQLVSCLLKRGPSHLATLKGELAQWLEEHEYHSLRQMQGSMNLEACPDPAVYERANYMLMLQSWRTTQ